MKKAVIAIGMIAFVLVLTLGVCLSAKADNPRYECLNGVCRLRTVERTVTRQALPVESPVVAAPSEPTPTPADPATKPVEAAPDVRPLRSVVVQSRDTVQRVSHRARCLLRRVFCRR